MANAVGIFGGFYLLFFMEKLLKMALGIGHEVREFIRGKHFFFIVERYNLFCLYNCMYIALVYGIVWLPSIDYHEYIHFITLSIYILIILHKSY